MELNKLELQSERGKECRDMIILLKFLNYPEDAIIKAISPYCFGSGTIIFPKDTDRQQVLNRIQEITV